MVVAEAEAVAVVLVAPAVSELFASFAGLAVVQALARLVALARSRIRTHTHTDPLAGFVTSRCSETVNIGRLSKLLCSYLLVRHDE